MEKHEPEVLPKTPEENDYKDEIAGDIDEKESELQEENGEKSLEEKMEVRDEED